MGTSSKSQGFTIVELLIVIVIIAILAAITIVAYNGIQKRAQQSSAQAAATNAIKKAEIYNADPDTTSYPATGATLTTATSTTTYRLDGVTWVAAMTTTAPSTPASLTFYKCGTGSTTAAPTTAAGVTSQTGVRIDYFNFQAGTGVISTTAGQTSGLVGTYNIGCAISNS